MLDKDKEIDSMPPQQPPTNLNDIMMAISPMMRQLERLDERSRDLATRSDLDALRKELVARDSFEPQMNAQKAQIIRVDTDRIADRAFLENRITRLEQEQISRQDRFGIRVSQAIAIAGFALALFEFLTHLKFSP